MTYGKLVLQAPPDHIALSQDAQAARLVDLGLIGASYGKIPASYLAGPRFLQLITFLGCSPNLQLDPPADGSDNFCHVRFRGPFQAPRLLAAGNTRPPRCPACGKGLGHWRQLEVYWARGESNREIVCLICNHSTSPAELNWRRKAGFGHYFIEIVGVFQEEAVPLPALMECLQGDGAAWRYFYLQ